MELASGSGLARLAYSTGGTNRKSTDIMRAATNPWRATTDLLTCYDQ